MVNIRRVKRSVFENYGIISFIGDVILLNGILLLAIMMRYDHISAEQEKEIKTFMVFMNMIWVSMMYFGKFYILARNVSIEKLLGRNVKYVFFLLVISFSLVEILNFDTISRLIHFYFFSMFIVAIFMFRLLLIKSLKMKRRSGKNTRFVVVVGGDTTSQSIAAQLNSDDGSGYKIVGVFNDRQVDLQWDDNVVKWSGTRNDLMAFLKKNWVDEIYFPISEITNEEFSDLIQLCERKFIRIKMLPNLNKFTLEHKIGIEFHGNIPVFTFIRSPLHSPLSRLIKKVFDIGLSIVVILTIFTWLFPIIIVLIKLSSKGPVFYKQERSGMNNKTFVIYKFRSMTVNEESDSLQATRDDPRITRIGRFMRKTNIDELPQFFNVLLGDMSVVGPRPHMLKHTNEYSRSISEYLERHYILPGITGWAQVNGFRGETPELYLMEKRVEFDVWYVQNWSFLLDIRILFLTTKNILKGEKNAF